MKLASALVAVAALAGLGAGQQDGSCTATAYRQEIRSLTPAQWSMTSAVVTQMNKDGWFQWFANIHQHYFRLFHKCEYFFPVHRRLIRDFEQTGLRYDPKFALPYWDTVRDYANPAASTVLSNAYIGANGAGTGQCVVGGLQASWSLGYPSPHCLGRQYNNGNTIKPIYSPEFIQSILTRSTNMTSLRSGIEMSLHGAVHIALGAEMMQMFSPNDFAFWLHHANLDRIWLVWQLMNPQQNFWSANGFDADGRPINLSSPLPFYNSPIGDVMLPGRKGMCFTYDNFSKVSNKRSLGRRNGKCIPRPAPEVPSGNLLGKLVDGVLEDVNDIIGNSEGAVVQTIATLPAPVLTKWFPEMPKSGEMPELSISNAPAVPEYGVPGAPAPAPDNFNPAASPKALMTTPETEPIDLPYSILGDVLPGHTYPMANPFPFPPAYMAMHGYSADEVRATYEEAVVFVKDLNTANYTSPFSGGIQSLIPNLDLSKLIPDVDLPSALPHVDLPSLVSDLGLPSLVSDLDLPGLGLKLGH